MAAGVWVGFDSHDPMGSHETGAGAALPAWISFMREASPSQAEFEAPRNVDYARIDPRTGMLAEPGAQDAIVLPFVTGTAPKRTTSQPPPGSEPQNFFMDQ
jgi:penicillin-binding protein 1A